MKITKHERRPIQDSQTIEASDIRNFTAEVNYGGFVGADESYDILATDEDDAYDQALDLVRDDLSIEDSVEVDEGEWEVTVGFAGFIGVENTYTVYENNEEDACDAAIEEAMDDISIDIFEQ